jgi:N6-L-threonylcarbamoyladenine synthase
MFSGLCGDRFVIVVMRILGIETSCDETAAAVVEETGDCSPVGHPLERDCLADLDSPRVGRVVPELASRQHIRDICGVVARALDEAGTRWSDLGAVAVTQGPGLVGSLLVGVSFAKASAAASGLPLVAVHHLVGHIESLVLQNGELPLPAVVLVVSGGHTSLHLIERPGDYQLLSRRRCLKRTGVAWFGYPGAGGRSVGRAGNDRAVALPTTRLTR